jgi:hypothetical protein
MAAKKIHRWTASEIEIIRQLYPDTPNPEIGKIFKVSESKISNLAHRLQLKKSSAFMENPLNRSCFMKGHVPKNKGRKQSSYMSAEQINKTKATRFQAGHLPKNTLSDGIITIRISHKERGAKPYKWIRIGLAKWKMYHVYLWEQEYGPVPHGHIIIFRDKDTMNCMIDNLMMITRAENARRNHNKDKAAETLKSLSDRYVAGKITPRNKQLRKKLLNEPDLLEIARQKMLLNRQIRNKNKHEQHQQNPST